MLLAPLPDTARLWLFAADRTLSPDEGTALLDRIRAFADGWTSHGRPVPAAAEFLHERVLAVGALIEEAAVNAGVSGCGIDALQHTLDAAAEEVGFAWESALAVLYRDSEGAVQALARSTFRRLAREHGVDAGTLVFDLTPDTVGALRAHGAERPASETWHGRVFGLNGAAAAVPSGSPSAA